MIKITKDRIKIDIDEQLTSKNLRNIEREIYSKIDNFRRNYVTCNCCKEMFDVMDKDSQHTEDGRLCSKCHETYTIEYHPEGGVGIKYTETGKWVNPCPRWL